MLGASLDHIYYTKGMAVLNEEVPAGQVVERWLQLVELFPPTPRVPAAQAGQAHKGIRPVKLKRLGLYGYVPYHGALGRADRC